MKKVYSGLQNIPNGKVTSENLINGCLVLEGGAFRGMYTQGFLDALMLHDVNLSCVIGVSAGALNGMCYVSGQIGRSARINLGFRHDARYVGWKAFLHSKSIIDLDFLTENRGIIEPFDEEAFMNSKQRFVAVVTNCLTGETEYFEKDNNIMQAAKASATMPYVSPMLYINGTPYLDGGCSCKIPYKWAIAQGYEKIIVVKTRQNGYRRLDKLSKKPHYFYHKYPRFAYALATSDRQWNWESDEIERLHAKGRLLRIAPSQPVTVGRLESDMEKLGDLYWMGYHDCERMLPKIRAYLGGTS